MQLVTFRLAAKEDLHRALPLTKLPDSLLKGPLVPSDKLLFFVAESAGKVVGLGRMKLNERRALLDSLVVHPDWRNKGVGFGLSEIQVRHAIDLGFNRLKVLVENKPSAIKSYGRLGFKVSGGAQEYNLVEMELVK